MFPRVRDITDALGDRLRVGLEMHPSGALVLIERPDRRDCGRVLLDGYAAEVLWGYIMSARLALPNGLPEEVVRGSFPTRFQLVREPRPAIAVTQAELERPFEISATFWDRLYAELCLVTAHSRELARRADIQLQ